MKQGNEIQTKNLSELHDGETAFIVKVKGHGAFRKRITEMGFVAGTKVKVIKKAPLQDPVEYELMGYRVSLRVSEAMVIEIIKSEADNPIRYDTAFNGTLPGDLLYKSAREKSHTINIALVGNPNCGKTTLFNFATGKHEKVGNYGGVTVDIKTAHVNRKGYLINITDLPGTYSLSEYSPEELYVRKHLATEMPDVVVNVIDASNLERNLYLTTQLIDMNVRIVVALNMFDELESKGDTFDYEMLARMTGIPFVPTVASKGKGIDKVLDKIIEVYNETDITFRHIHINHGEAVNQSLEQLRSEVKKLTALTDKYHTQYVAVKLLEKDKAFLKEIEEYTDISGISEVTAKEVARLEAEFSEKTETIITDAKYAFIRGALKETYRHSLYRKKSPNHKADAILTHKWFGFPVFFIIMWTTFQLTFMLGSYPMEWIEAGVTALNRLTENILPEGMVRDLLTDGVIGGVGSVIVFLPNILILFFCISLMEDTGYMARTAFIMDKMMHLIGLHGKSFIPLLMGFGCNVPAIMATRVLENRKDRFLTILIIPFMSCSARLPVYVLLISAFFPAKQGLVLLSIYSIGILLSVITALIFRKMFFRKKEAPFVMELPPYRIPTLRSTLIHMWDKSVQYLTKMGTIILTASVLIWALGYFPRQTEYPVGHDAVITGDLNSSILISSDENPDNFHTEEGSGRLEKSYIGQLGHFIEPVIAPLGFDWKIGVSIISGLAAKEIVVGSMGVLYQSGSGDEETTVNLQKKLQQQVFTSGTKKGQKVFTPLIAFSLMLFILIYFPCIAVITAIKKEAGLKWALFTMFYTTGLAWMLSFIIYQTSRLL